jgi:nucleoside kinase
MKPFLTVYGHVCVDQIFSLDRLPEPNTSVDIRERRCYYGGTGANIATAAAVLGVPTALVSYVGPDLPSDFREFMASRGVDLQELITVPGYESPTVLIVSDREENQVAFVYQGPMADMGRFELRTVGAEMSRFVHVSTGRPEYYLPLMSYLQGRGKEVAFDPAQELGRVWDPGTFRKALSNTSILFTNRNELPTALRYADAAGPEGLLDKVPVIINTRGAEGAVVWIGKGSWVVPPARPERLVDPTGAGDAFRAGFYAGRYYGHGLLESVAYGNSAASYVLEAAGAVTKLPTWEQVEARADEIIASLP